jgi:hypothetical protein
MDFNVKKLLSNGMDLMPRRRSGIRVGFVDLCRPKLVSRGKQVYAEVYQELLRQVQRTYPYRTYILLRLEDWSTPARPLSSSWRNSHYD